MVSHLGLAGLCTLDLMGSFDSCWSFLEWRVQLDLEQHCSPSPADPRLCPEQLLFLFLLLSLHLSSQLRRAAWLGQRSEGQGRLAAAWQPGISAQRNDSCKVPLPAPHGAPSTLQGSPAGSHARQEQPCQAGAARICSQLL